MKTLIALIMFTFLSHNAFAQKNFNSSKSNTSSVSNASTDVIKMVEDAGITFIGPSSQTVELMGNKTSARTLMKKNNVPIVPGTTEPIKSVEEAEKTALEIGLPIMLKASAGGGGKGMRRVDKIEDLRESLERAQNESLKAFSNDAV